MGWHSNGGPESQPLDTIQALGFVVPLLSGRVQVNCDGEVVKRDQRVLLEPDIYLVSPVFFFSLSSVLKQ